MFHPWRIILSTGTWTLLGHPKRGLESNGLIFARSESDESSPAKKTTLADDASSIVVGVIFCLFLVSLAGLAVFYFFKRQRQRAGDIESGGSEKRNWWMVDSKNEKQGVMDWWRQSHSIPDRVEPPPSAKPRLSLQRLRSALTRNGLLNAQTPKESCEIPPVAPQISVKVTSPTITIDLPLQTVPQHKPRYPSVLERGYRVPLYPVQSPPKDNSPPRSLTSPAPPRPAPPAPQSAHPISVAERRVQRKITLPPRALRISNGRPLVPLSERKTGLARSPAHRRRNAFINQIKHPFLPLKDSDTPFPTISAPMPSAETAATNPKLGYAYSMSKPRSAPMAPGGPRQLTRSTTRRVPVPIFETAPSRPLLPATPLHLREETRVLPPGLSPTVPRPTPTPI